MGRGAGSLERRGAGPRLRMGLRSLDGFSQTSEARCRSWMLNAAAAQEGFAAFLEKLSPRLSRQEGDT